MNPLKLIKKAWGQKIIRFVCVGAFNTVLDFTLLNVMFAVLKFPTLLANSISVTVSITVSYFLNHKIVFRHPEKYSIKNYIRFFLITGFSVIVIQNLIIYTATKLVVIHAGASVRILGIAVPADTARLNLAKAAAVVVGMVWNFLLYKFVVFRNQDMVDEADELVLA